MHPFFQIFGKDISAYGLMAVLGAAIAVVFVALRNRGNKYIQQSDLVNIGALALCGVMIGAKALSLITLAPSIIANASIVFSSIENVVALLLGGWVFYGGLIGGIVAVWLYCRKYNEDFSAVCALITPAIPLFHAFGRVGCFLAGCCYGIEHELGIAYTESISAPNGIPYLPIQLIEAGLNLILFVALLIAQRYMKNKAHAFPLYIVSYAIIRFVLEFWRGDAIRGIVLFSTSQWIAIASVICVVAWYIWSKRRQQTVVCISE